MTNPTADNIVRKIQALLAKAQSSEFGPERDTFQEKADQLIARYAVEQYQLDEALRAAGKAPSQTAIVREYSYPYSTGVQRDLARYVNRLFSTLTNSIGVRVMFEEYRTARDENGLRTGSTDTVWKVVGYEADLAYLDLLFISLQMQMLAMLEPEPTPALSFDANVHALHDAGVKWEDIARRMNVARETRGATWEHTPWDYKAKDGGRLIRAYKRECKKLGLAPLVVTVSSSYREDFVFAFCSTISRRMRETRAEVGGGLVLARRQTEIDELWDSLQPAPVEVAETTPAKKGRVAKVRYRAMSVAGEDAGRRAGARADLSRSGSRVGAASGRGIGA